MVDCLNKNKEERFNLIVHKYNYAYDKSAYKKFGLSSTSTIDDIVHEYNTCIQKLNSPVKEKFLYLMSSFIEDFQDGTNFKILNNFFNGELTKHILRDEDEDIDYDNDYIGEVTYREYDIEYFVTPIDLIKYLFKVFNVNIELNLLHRLEPDGCGEVEDYTSKIVIPFSTENERSADVMLIAPV